MAHRSVLYNDAAKEEFVDQFGETFDETVERNHEARGFSGAAEKQVIGSGGVYRAIETGYFFRNIPLDDFVEGYNDVLELYQEGGITSFGSRLGTALWITVFHYMLRQQGRLPVRFGYSLEVHRGFIPSESVERFYEMGGTQWDVVNHPESSSEWLWQHGVSSEGAWDSVQRACLGSDLEAVSDEAKSEEQCPTLYDSQQAALRNALESLYRLVGVHMVGSHGARLWIQMVKDAIDNSQWLNKERVQQMRLGGAHGTMIGKPGAGNISENVDETVYSELEEFNVYVPINIARALQDEPDTILDRYGEDGLEFLAPVKTLLEHGVKVVGESENTEPYPEWYFEVLNAYVNRFTVREGAHTDESVSGDTDVWVPEEGVDRVTALKLITYRSAEFLHAEDKVGSLEPGKLADYVIVENDFLEARQSNIRDNRVIATAIDGEIEYEADDLDQFVKRTEC